MGEVPGEASKKTVCFTRTSEQGSGLILSLERRHEEIHTGTVRVEKRCKGRGHPHEVRHEVPVGKKREICS